MRGYFGIGIASGKAEINVGTLWRSAHAFGAAFIFTAGRRYPRQSSDVNRAYRHIPLFEYSSTEDFLAHRPKDCVLVGVECGLARSKPLPSFCHPERTLYVLGAEDHGLSKRLIEACNQIVEIPGVDHCLNVATAGSIVLYDRKAKSEPR